MSNHEWRWADPAGQQRLVRTDELRAALASGVIPANAPVWRRGWPGWKPAHEVPELSTSALAAANGVLLNVPPPPLFVVAAQSEFEDKGGGPDEAALEEPPLPPRYEPIASAVPAAPPVVPPKVEAKPKPPEPKPEPKPPVQAKPEPSPKPAMVIPKPAEPTAKPPAAKAKEPLKIPAAPMGKAPARPAMVPAPSNVATSPRPTAVAASPNARPAAPPPGPPPGSEMRSIPTMRGIPIMPDKVPKIDMPNVAAAAARPATTPKASPVAADAPSSLKRATLPVFPAPPPMTKVEDSAHPAPVEAVAKPAPEAVQPLPSRNPTLIQFGGAPESTPPPAAATAPINVPPPEPSEVTGGSVTRPPPWGEGSVGMQPDIPKQPTAPKIAPENVEELSGSMLLPDAGPPPIPLRPHELSSSDLTSEVDIPVAKPPPLAPADKRGGTLGTPPPPLVAPVAAAATPAPPPVAPVAPIAAPPPVEEDAAVDADEVEEVSAPPLAPTVPTKRPSIPPAPPQEETVPRFAPEPSDWQRSLRDRPPWQLAAGGALGMLVLLGLVFGIAKLAGSGPDAATSASAGGSATAPPTVATTTTASAVTTATVPVPAAKDVQCVLAGEAKTIASHAMVGSGVEARAAAGGIALGFASGPKDATLALVDPSSLAPSTTKTGKSVDPVRRVVALDGGVAIDVDRKGDKLQGRRAVAGAPAIDLGSDGSNVAWAAHGTDKTIALFPLGGTGPVEALRGERSASTAFVAFRQGTSIYVGAFAGDPPAAKGALAKVDGLGPKVGSPALAVSGDTAFVVWADRASDGEPWGLRYLVVHAGKDPGAAKKFEVPAGGLGEHAMSPGVAAVGSGRWLVSWTEGPTSSHQVRAVVVDDAGAVHGAALTISAEGVNAGQGQAAVGSDGKGVVAFLAGSGKSFDVIARGISCTEK